MTKFFFILFAVCTLNAHAMREVKVATISSNIDRETTEFFLEVAEDGSLDGVRMLTKNLRGQQTEERRATVEEVIDSGMVLRRESNRDAIILRVQNFTPEAGGKVIVDYLYSGVNNSRRKLNLGIKKTTGDFFLHTTSGESATMLKVFGNWAPILGLIGIADIRVMDRWWQWGNVNP